MEKSRRVSPQIKVSVTFDLFYFRNFNFTFVLSGRSCSDTQKVWGRLFLSDGGVSTQSRPRPVEDPVCPPSSVPLVVDLTVGSGPRGGGFPGVS